MKLKFSRTLILFASAYLMTSISAVWAQKMSEKWHQLGRSIDKEIETIQAIRNLGPALRYRLLALKTEKIKLTKERENQLFLDHSVKGKTKGTKESYFTLSKKETQDVESQALALLKTYPKFEYTADLLYMLALNDRDYLKGERAERYLLGALARAPGGSPLIHATKTGLAEYYYNEKQYSKALHHYQDVLRNKHDEWASKHTTNAAWCYFKVQQYERAIALLEESFFLSKDKRYIDVAEQTLEAMSVFYVRGGEVARGIKFYLQNAGDEKVSYLIKLAKRATDQGLFEETKEVLDTAIKVAIQSKNFEQQIDIRLTELEVYRTFKRHELFYVAAKDLYRLDRITQIGPVKKEEAIQKIKELVGYLQIRVSRNSKINVKDYDQAQLTQVINYFTILSGLDPDNRDQYAFFQGETYFSVGQFKNAANAYVKALNTSIKMTKFEYEKLKAQALAKDKNADLSKLKFVDQHLPQKKKIMDSLLAVIEQGEFGPQQTQKLSLYAFKNHILIWPEDERSRVIYPKLFNLYFKNKKMDEAQWTIDTYTKNFASDLEKQRQMFTLVLDSYMKGKDTEKVAFWIRKLEKGYLSFERDVIVKATILLGNILFERYHELDQAGKKDEALQGYTSLYLDPQYPRKIKANAALNASILAGQLLQEEASFDWMIKSHAVMEREDAIKNAPKYDALSENLALAGNFKLGAISAYKNLTFLCSFKSQEKSALYRRAVEYSIVLNDIKLAFETWKLANRCGLEAQEKIKAAKQMILFSAKMRDHRHLEALHNVFGTSSELVPVFAISYYDLYWDAKSSQQALAKTYWKKLGDYLSHPDMPDDIRANIRAIKESEALVAKIKARHHFQLTNSPTFLEDQFNSELESAFLTLKSFSDEAAPLFKAAELEVALALYEVLVESNEKLRAAITAFTPRGVPPEFVAGFKESMKGLAAELDGRSAELKRLSFELRQKNKWMGRGSWSFVKVVEDSSVNLRYPAAALSRASDLKIGGPQ